MVAAMSYSTPVFYDQNGGTWMDLEWPAQDLKAVVDACFGEQMSSPELSGVVDKAVIEDGTTPGSVLQGVRQQIVAHRCAAMNAVRSPCTSLSSCRGPFTDIASELKALVDRCSKFQNFPPGYNSYQGQCPLVQAQLVGPCGDPDPTSLRG